MVWVFRGPRLSPGFPGAVFSELARAEAWIARVSASGTLLRYPVDVGVYEWAVATGRYAPRDGADELPEFVESFSSARQEQRHYHRGALSAA